MDNENETQNVTKLNVVATSNEPVQSVLDVMSHATKNINNMAQVMLVSRNRDGTISFMTSIQHGPDSAFLISFLNAIHYKGFSIAEPTKQN
jgi:hypothetical protein